MRLFSTWAACAAALLVGTSASAAEGGEDDVTAALFSGSMTALVPFSVGATMMTTSEGRGGRNVGLLLAEGGLVAAPLVAHGVAGEWRRGLTFAALPAIAAAGLDALLLARPSVVTAGASKEVQYAFVITLGATVFASAVGCLDVLGAPARRKKSKAALMVIPHAGAGQIGATLVRSW